MLSQGIGISISLPPLDTGLGNGTAVSPTPSFWVSGTGAFWVDASGNNWVTLY